MFTWGKGDYHRLGHGNDDHVRRPRKVAALQGKRVVSISTGSLHCVACTDQGEEELDCTLSCEVMMPPCVLLAYDCEDVAVA